ncbi:hypothetical protein BJ546DRAFT_200942 [Cryomyces antarcticus]
MHSDASVLHNAATTCVTIAFPRHGQQRVRCLSTVGCRSHPVIAGKTHPASSAGWKHRYTTHSQHRWYKGVSLYLSISTQPDMRTSTQTDSCHSPPSLHSPTMSLPAFPVQPSSKRGAPLLFPPPPSRFPISTSWRLLLPCQHPITPSQSHQSTSWDTTAASPSLSSSAISVPLHTTLASFARELRCRVSALSCVPTALPRQWKLSAQLCGLALDVEEGAGGMTRGLLCSERVLRFVFRAVLALVAFSNAAGCGCLSGCGRMGMRDQGRGV